MSAKDHFQDTLENVKGIPSELTDAQIDQITAALELLISIYQEKPE